MDRPTSSSRAWLWTTILAAFGVAAVGSLWLSTQHTQPDRSQHVERAPRRVTPQQRPHARPRPAPHPELRRLAPRRSRLDAPVEGPDQDRGQDQSRARNISELEWQRLSAEHEALDVQLDELHEDLRAVASDSESFEGGDIEEMLERIESEIEAAEQQLVTIEALELAAESGDHALVAAWVAGD